MRLKYPLLFTTLLFCANSYAIEIFGMNLGFGYDSYEECVFDKVKQCGTNDYNCTNAGRALCAKECPLVDKYLKNIPLQHPPKMNRWSEIKNYTAGVLVNRIHFKMAESNMNDCAFWMQSSDTETVDMTIFPGSDIDFDDLFVRVRSYPPGDRKYCFQAWGEGERIAGERACK